MLTAGRLSAGSQRLQAALWPSSFPFRAKQGNAPLVSPGLCFWWRQHLCGPRPSTGFVMSADGLFQADTWHRRFSAKCDSDGEGLVSVIPCGFVEGEEENQLLVPQYFNFIWNCGDPGRQ